MAMVDEMRSKEEDDGWQSSWSLTDPTRELSWNEKRIPLLVEDYLAEGERYFSDSKSLGVVAVGEGNALRKAGGRGDTRYGAWLTRWKHWSLKVQRGEKVGFLGLPYARSAEESEYQQKTAECLDQYARDGIRISVGVNCGGFRPNNLEKVYFLDRWETGCPICR